MSGAGGRFADLDADSVHVDRGAGDPRGLAKESSFALVGLDQVEGHVCGKGENQPREAGAGAEVDGTIARAAYQ